MSDQTSPRANGRQNDEEGGSDGQEPEQVEPAPMGEPGPSGQQPVDGTQSRPAGVPDDAELTCATCGQVVQSLYQPCGREGTYCNPSPYVHY